MADVDPAADAEDIERKCILSERLFMGGRAFDVSLSEEGFSWKLTQAPVSQSKCF